MAITSNLLRRARVRFVVFVVFLLAVLRVVVLGKVAALGLLFVALGGHRAAKLLRNVVRTTKLRAGMHTGV